MATKKTSALSKKPGFKLATDLAGLEAQRRDPANASNRAAISTAIAAARKTASTPQTGGGLETQGGFQQQIDNANTAGNDLFAQIKDSGKFTPQTMGIGSFNPGDFQQTYQQAYDSTLNEFNRNNQTSFDKQNADFQQMAAERGWDPNSEVAKGQFKQIQDAQNNARQGAQNSAVGAGLAAQNQAYGQNLSSYGQNLQAQGQQYGQQFQQYQMPYQNLAAISPYFNAQAQSGMQNDQFAFQGGQNAMDRQNQRWLLQNAPRGGGGGGSGAMSLADQIALQNNNFYNNMALLGAQGGQPTGNQTGNSAISGFAAGVGTGLGQGLLK